MSFAENLKKIMDEAGITLPVLADAVGVSLHSVAAWRVGRTEPHLDTLLRVAEVLGVSMDYLAGRCTKEEEAEIEKDFRAYFKSRWETAYLNWLSLPAAEQARQPAPTTAPWPYNLLNEVFGQWATLLNPMQEKGLEKALKMLAPREREILLLVHKDEKPNPEIGRMYDVTAERVRQIAAKAASKLRYPSAANLIRDGYDETGWLDILQQREEIVNLREAELTDWADALREKEQELNEREETMRGISEQELDCSTEMLERPIEDLLLSVRAYNCLMRANMSTVGDVVFNNKPFSSISGMGVKTFGELRDKIRLVTGKEINY